MELIDQHTKEVMEGCKERARAAGLSFTDETLEYIVTNRDLVELMPKNMIPTLYDYWVHDVEVLKEKGKYELYPTNPYETVINTRPAISFYNDNNPDWLNVMIFYHVLAHIDFFQNNVFFGHTWDYDFNGQALADKRLIARLRSKHGRWVDYVIEFSRGIDNIVGYHAELARGDGGMGAGKPSRLDYYFDLFLQSEKRISTADYMKELDNYNQAIREHKELGEKKFFDRVAKKHPEFEATFQKYLDLRKEPSVDLLDYLIRNSEFLAKRENRWMRSILEIVRKTSLFFQPQIRTKIMNEGWASYWHQELFLSDDRIKGHEVDYSRINAYVTSMPRVGLNPYALGMRLFQYLEDLADKGKLSLEYELLADAEKRRRFDKKTGLGRERIFKVRRELCDYTFIAGLVDQDFVNKHRLFVSGKRLNRGKRVWEYYVQSRDAADYRQMLLDALYHPPRIEVDTKQANNGPLYLVHHFEGKPLVQGFLANTMLGLEYLWGGPVKLETSEAVPATPGPGEKPKEGGKKTIWKRVTYTMENRKLARKTIGEHHGPGQG